MVIDPSLNFWLLNFFCCNSLLFVTPMGFLSHFNIYWTFGTLLFTSCSWFGGDLLLFLIYSLGIRDEFPFGNSFQGFICLGFLLALILSYLITFVLQKWLSDLRLFPHLQSRNPQWIPFQELFSKISLFRFPSCVNSQLFNHTCPAKMA